MQNFSRVRERFFFIFSAALALCLFIYVYSVWDSLPNKVPSHFAFNGKADNWGSKSFIILLPAIYLCILGVALVLRKIPSLINIPFKVSEEKRPEAVAISFEMLALLNLQIGILFFYITLCIVKTAENPDHGLGTWFLPIVLGTFILTITIYLLKMKRCCG